MGCHQMEKERKQKRKKTMATHSSFLSPVKLLNADAIVTGWSLKWVWSRIAAWKIWYLKGNDQVLTIHGLAKATWFGICTNVSSFPSKPSPSSKIIFIYFAGEGQKQMYCRVNLCSSFPFFVFLLIFTFLMNVTELELVSSKMCDSWKKRKSVFHQHIWKG